MTRNHSAWMPAQGRHRVNIGSSLKRALKARKGIAATRRSNLPDRDFYSFRCRYFFFFWAARSSTILRLFQTTSNHHQLTQPNLEPLMCEARIRLVLRLNTPVSKSVSLFNV